MSILTISLAVIAMTAVTIFAVGMYSFDARLSVVETQNKQWIEGREGRVAQWNRRMGIDSVQRQETEKTIDSLQEITSKLNKRIIALEQKQTQRSALWIIPDIPDLTSAVATLLFWIGITIVSALSGVIIVQWKAQQDLLKSFLPLLAELKTILYLNRK